MKNIITIIFLPFLLLSCSNVAQDRAQGPVSVSKEHIDSLMDVWHAAAAEANFEGYFSLLDSVSVFIGTDATENWTKEQFSTFSKPYFDKGKAWSFHAMERNVYFNRDSTVAWFDELLDTWMGTCRGSGVFELTDQHWKLKHYVLSVAIPNESIDEVIEVKAEEDSLFIVSTRQLSKSERKNPFKSLPLHN